MFGKSRPLPRKTTKEVRDILSRFLANTVGPYEFDDFVSEPIGDTRLDAIRERCDELPAVYKPENAGHYCGEGGIQEMRQFIRELDDGAI